MQPKKDLTKGDIPKSIIALSLPIFGGLLIQNLFIIVDTFFVAKLGPDAIAAVSASSPIFFIIIALITGLNVGVAALIAKAVGSKNYSSINEIAENSLLLSVIVSIALTIFGMLSIGPIISFLGVQGDVASMMSGFLKVLYLGNISFFIGQVAGGMLNGEGDTITPMKGFIIALVINIILDPILIFGYGIFPALGVKGAAWATIIGRSIGTIYILWHLFSGKALVKLAFKKLSWAPKIMKDILSIGMPTAASQLGVSGGIFFLNKIVVAFGTIALAGFGIAYRIESLVVMPGIAFGTVALAMVGQNFGAKNFSRAHTSAHIASIFAFIITELIGIGLFFWSHYIIGLFTNDSSVIAQAISYFKIVGFSYGFLGLRFISVNSFQALGKAINSFITTIVHFLFLLGIAYLLAFDTSTGIKGIWIGIALANVVMGILSSTWFWIVIDKMKRIEVHPEEAVIQDD
jgi:putative MATE family efflux protein